MKMLHSGNEAIAVRQDISRNPKLMFVGAAHWSNPGKDFLAVEFDDMLSPERQRQIESCLDQLVRFAPTKVAVEVMVTANQDLNADYQGYCRGEFPLTANERHQFGFRLAGMMGHDRIHAIDWHDLTRAIGWDLAIDFAREHDQVDRVSAFEPVSDDEQAAENARVRALTVREQLLETSDPQNVAKSHHVYMDLALVGAGENYIGADVVLRWYERNMKIFVNIGRLVESPADRILVVIGGGHLPLLTHFAESSGRFDVVSALDYLDERVFRGK